jgi:putative membrane protein
MMLTETLHAAAAAVRLAPLGLVVRFEDLANVLVSTAIFTIFGLIVFAVAFGIIGKATPFSIRKELEEDHNTALAIVIGAVIIGIALIIAATVQG